ncbi:polyphosphate kinase 1 [Natroniella sulfidigena]|uniref:polyphosphate kinase 1 n=1 Tax=Natroniella sulfidigena TaxID=723921 RepID=UPI00200AB41C|nr:polyphosphate kinase 1 [Natroniella sulfidigena]MCK8817419.1 polyphosphate kinase 1 [Natroniella sulfidigena]
MNYKESKYYNSKQLSWIKFNGRVLEEAQDESNPLLERAKFLAITASNLDEFVMVRVARLKKKVNLGVTKQDKAGYKPQQLLAELLARIHELVAEQYSCFADLLTSLEREGISFTRIEDLTEKQRLFLEQYFTESIYPLLTPLTITQVDSFPLLSNKKLYLAVRLTKDQEELFSVIKIPDALSRIVELPTVDDEKREFILIEEVIKEYLEIFYSDYQIEAVDIFRITRNADIEIDEEAEDILLEMEDYLKRRKRGFPVRLEVEEKMDDQLKQFLLAALELDQADRYEVAGPVDLTFLLEISQLEGYEQLRFEPLVPQPAQDFNGYDDIFAQIKERDRLANHPYESFEPVIELVQQAAVDPKVVAIKQTIYRVSEDSPIIEALIKAAENGKQVTVFVELKARFDEENNIALVKRLKKVGCQVLYGLVDVKVHAKALMVSRVENDRIKRYIHLSTGNYNDQTAKVYTDIGMFTAKDDFGVDISKLFNLLRGSLTAIDWEKIAVAPFNLRENFIKLIRNEIKQVKLGKEGRIIAKMNALVDQGIITELYRASKAGVKIDLIVRGMCCLYSGRNKLSENIRVISIVGRFLEHSRVFYFHNGGATKLFLASADWRPRNLNRRIEVLFPVEEEDLKERIINTLEIILSDTVKARKQQPDGTYQRVESEERQLEAQQILLLPEITSFFY